MKKILILGEAPLPIENRRILTGPGIRTWQFIKPALDRRHKVCLICFQTPGAYAKKEQIRKNISKNFTYYSIGQKNIQNVAYFQKIHDSFRPDCILSMSSYCPMYLATQIKSVAPVWFDQGDLMVEAQIKSYVDNNSDSLYDFLKLERRVLSRGDVFSTVSTPQKFALIGKLGENGRLNKETTGYEFVHVIPCGVERKRFVHNKTIIRGKYVKRDDFVILWSGGYNNWVDIDTLYLALEKAMSKNEKIKFVSSAGPISSQSETLYAHFLKLINESEFKDRYIMLGWLPTKDLHNLYLESNIGINIDRYCYEVLLGSRHRILDWMRAGLPVLTTETSELTKILSKEKMIITFPINDSDTLSRTILSLSSQSRRLRRYSRNAKKFVYENFLNEKTIKPFLDWLDSLKCSPDMTIRNKKGHFDYSENDLGNLEQNYIKSLKEEIHGLKFKDAEREKVKGELNAKEIETTNLRNHAANLEGQREGLKTHINNLESEREGIKNHAKALNLHSSSLEKQLQDLQKQLQETAKDRDSLKWKAKDLEIERATLRHHASNLEGEREGLKTHIKNLEAGRNSLESSIERLNNQISNLETEREILKNRAGELNGHLNDIYASKAYKLYKIIRKVKFL